MLYRAELTLRGFTSKVVSLQHHPLLSVLMFIAAGKFIIYDAWKSYFSSLLSSLYDYPEIRQIPFHCYLPLTLKRPALLNSTRLIFIVSTVYTELHNGVRI